ncbi:MAG: DUF411 domain-containing protein [Alphaproteobacteria bacterium]|nr:DUF411 domain-containing protein [Alphaproteobacteria bacterium]
MYARSAPSSARPAISRRAALVGGAALALMPAAAIAQAPSIHVNRDPGCGCCEGWIAHLRASGFAATVFDAADMRRIKTRLGVPDDLASCHTGEIAGYAIEGHVPAQAIRRLVKERPRAQGLAVPGMPIGSPGMEVEGMPPEEYDVILFGPVGRRTYARFKGVVERSA